MSNRVLPKQLHRASHMGRHCCIAASHLQEAPRTKIALEDRRSLPFPTTDELPAQPPFVPARAGKTRGRTMDTNRPVLLSGGTLDSPLHWSRRRCGAELRGVPSAAPPKTRGKVPRWRARYVRQSSRESILAHNDRLEFCYLQ